MTLSIARREAASAEAAAGMTTKVHEKVHTVMKCSKHGIYRAPCLFFPCTVRGLKIPKQIKKMKLAVLFLALAAALVVFAPGEHLFGYMCEVLDAICAEWRASFRSGCRICA